MDIKEIEQAVYNINNALYELLPEMVGDGYYELTLLSDGYTIIIRGLGTNLWDDEDDDVRIGLEGHLKQKILCHVKNISKIKF